MLLLGQAPSGALSAGRCCSYTASHNFTLPKSSLFFHRKPKSIPTSNHRKCINLTVAKADDAVESSPAPAPKQPLSSNPNPSFDNNETVFVGQKSVPLEGVIQFDKSDLSSRLSKWGRVALLSGGDVMALLLFSAIGRFSHGFPVFDFETLRTADPFIAGWFLSAYFLGGYGEDGRGMNGWSKSVLSAAKSWALGIPLGLAIRAAVSGHIPPYSFILVTMGSTAFLLVGWRALLFSIFPGDKNKNSDVYRKGSPFELFELLTSLVRRW